MDADDRRVYDLVVRRFLAALHPEAVLENTRVETTVAEHVFRTRGKVLLVPGWRGVYLDGGRATRRPPRRAARRTSSTTGSCRASSRASPRGRSRSRRSPRRPSRRAATATRRCSARWRPPGKLVDDEELREAMKDSGIGTPATRAAIIERLIDVGYVERDGRSLVATEKGLDVIRLLGEHALTSPDLTGSWEQRLGRIERGEDSREQFMHDIAGFAQRDRRRARRDAQGRADPARQPRPVPGLRPRHRREPQGLLVLVARGPRLRLRDLEGKAGKQLPLAVARELIVKRSYRAPGDRLPRAQRALVPRAARAEQTPEGKWRVDFDEPWAREGAKPPEVEVDGAATAAAAVSAAHGSLSARPPADVAPAVRHHGRFVSLTLVTGPANSAKAAVVLERYRAAARAGADPRRSARRRRRALPPRARARRARARRARRVISRADARDRAPRRDRRSTARRARAIERAARSAPSRMRTLAALAGAAASPRFASELARFAAELELRRVSPARLGAALRAWATADAARAPPRRASCAAIYGALQRRGSSGSGATTGPRMRSRRSTRCALAPARWGATPVLCYGFDDLDRFSSTRSRRSRTLSARLSCCRSRASRAGSRSQGAPRRSRRCARARARSSSWRPLDPTTSLTRASFHPTSSATLFEPRPGDDGRQDRRCALLEALDERDEAELIAAEIAALLAAGFAPGDLAVVARTLNVGRALAAAPRGACGPRHAAAARALRATPRSAAACWRCCAPRLAGGGGRRPRALAARRRAVAQRASVDRFEARLLRGGVRRARRGARAVGARALAARCARSAGGAARRPGPALLEASSASSTRLLAAPCAATAALLDDVAGRVPGRRRGARCASCVSCRAPIARLAPDAAQRCSRALERARGRA